MKWIIIVGVFAVIQFVIRKIVKAQDRKMQAINDDIATKEESLNRLERRKDWLQLKKEEGERNKPKTVYYPMCVICRKDLRQEEIIEDNGFFFCTDCYVEQTLKRTNSEKI